MTNRKETELYAPIKLYLESQGYEVRGEVKHCDLVAVRADEEVVIVELKRTFGIPLLLQGIERLRHTDRVYVAFEKSTTGRAPQGASWDELVELCRRIGLGLLTVRFFQRKKPTVELLCDPKPYMPRKSAKRTAGLLTEFHERSADYNIGGSTRRKLVTAYREKALRCALALRDHGPLPTSRIRELTGNPKVTALMQHNYYNWFARVSRGVYTVTPAGISGLEEYAHVIHGYRQEDAGTTCGPNIP